MTTWKWTSASSGPWGDAASWTDVSSSSHHGVPADGDTVVINGVGPFVIASDELTDITAYLDAESQTDAQLGFVTAAVPSTFRAFENPVAPTATVGFNVNSSYAGTLTAGVNGGTFSVKLGAEQANTLTLASGGQLVATNNGTLTIGPYLSGTTTPVFANEGTVTANAGLVMLSSGLSIGGSGKYVIERGGTLSFGNEPVPSSAIVEFGGNNGTLALTDPAGFAGTITNFEPGDRIVFGTADFIDAVAYDSATGILTASYHGAPVAALSVATTGSPTFSVRFADSQESVILGSQAARMWQGGAGDYFTASQWSVASGTSSSYPLGGDTAVIGSGLAIVSEADIAAHGILDWQTLVLGGSNKVIPATLAASNATFGGDFEIDVPDGSGAGTASFAALDMFGSTTFNGRLYDTGAFAHLDIKVGPQGAVPGTMTFGANADIEVAQESRLVLEGGSFDNEAAITVTGHLEIDDTATVGGAGEIELNGDATVQIDGAVESGQRLVFNGDSGRIVIDNLAGFQGAVAGLVQGARVVLPNADADAISYDASTGELSLSNDGVTIGSFAVDDWLGNGASDFTLSSRPGGGITIGYVAGPFQLIHQQLPVVVAAAAGSKIDLSTILAQGFGASASKFSGFGFAETDAKLLADNHFRYWTPPATNSVASWTVPNVTIEPGYLSSKILPTIVPSSEASHITLTAGSNIANYQFVDAPVATNATGGVTALNTYSLVVVDPNVIAPTAYGGIVDPIDIVSSAIRFANYYTDCSADNDCGFIADAVGAAAGAVLPWDVSTDPDTNVEGGFWRIVYRGSNPNPVADWFTLTKPGDVVRMGHVDAGQHTTTIVGTINPDGSIPVYDNVDTQPDGTMLIGLHDATYDTHTEPDTVTIYRLDPLHQYLINGTTHGELIVGSPWNNLIRPNGGADTIVAGNGNNEIQGTAADIDGITAKDFHPGDWLNVEDLDPKSAGTVYDGTSGTLKILAAGTTVATATMPLGLTGAFTTSSDGARGTKISLGLGPGMVSIVGAAGAVTTLTFATPAGYALASQSAATINGAASNGRLTAFNLPESAPTVPSGNVSEAVIPPGAGGGSYVAPAGYQFVVDGETAPVTLTGAANQTVLSGTGGMTFVAAGSSNTVVFGGGNNTANLASSSNDLVQLGSGADTVSMDSASNSTIAGGTGSELLFDSSSSGNTYFLSAGDSTVVGGAGSNRIIAGAGAATVFGGTGKQLVFGNTGSLTFVGGSGVATVVGGSTGPTLFGSAGSDIDFYTASAPGILVAGGGNETLNGGGAPVGSAFWGGTGSDVIVGGTGNDTIVGGAGQYAASGGAGADVFAFFAGHAGGLATITDFAADDRMLLQGYGSTAITSSVVTRGGLTLSLADGTQITFVGLSSINPNQVVTT